MLVRNSAALLAAVALGALFYGTAPAAAQGESPSDNRAEDRSYGDRPSTDPATIRDRIRKTVAQDIQDSYSLLLDDLGLRPDDRENLIALLIVIQLEGIHTSETRGRKVTPEERSARIAAVIGDEKLRELLVLQQNRRSYWETQQIASLLGRRNVALTEAQRDGVFDVLVEVHARYPETRRPDLEGLSLESFEHTLAQLDEFDRHVIELAPSLLTPTQVAHLFAAYQAMSYSRAAALEREKRWRADHPGEDRPWGYPARWSPP